MQVETKKNELGYDGPETAEDVLKWALEKYHPRIGLACSFQHTVLVELMLKIKPDANIFAIDTGRLPEETYQCARDIETRYGIKINWYFPKHDAIEKLTREKGMFSFLEGLEARNECCGIRKVEPLNRALSELDAWITGVRKDQNKTRKDYQIVEHDKAHGGIIKINPLVHWTTEEMNSYVKKNKLIYNSLFDKGYTSIGCACCTRPIEQGEHDRAGRWWWEDSENKECGLHARNWNI